MVHKTSTWARLIRICNLHCSNSLLATNLKLQLAKGSCEFYGHQGHFRPSGGSSQVLVWNRPQKASCALTQNFYNLKFDDLLLYV